MGLTFEQAILKLEEIAVRLESGELSLDEAMKLYENGVKLSDYCTKQLQTAETKIIELKELLNKNEQN